MTRGGARGSGYAGGRGGAWARSRSQKPTTRGKPGNQNTESRAIPAVDFTENYVNKIGRPFPGDVGQCFVRLGGASRDKDLVDIRQVAERLTHLNFEGMGRAGRWLSMNAASHEQGALYVRKYCTGIQAPAFESTGIPKILEFLDSDVGQSLLNASRLLNESNNEERPVGKIREAVIALMRGYNQETDVGDAFGRLAIFSRQCYMLSMSFITGMGVMANRPRWANELQSQLPSMPQEVRAFVRAPEDDRALLEALVACYSDQVLQSKQACRRAEMLSDGEDELPEDDGIPGQQAPANDIDDLFGDFSSGCASNSVSARASSRGPSLFGDRPAAAMKASQKVSSVSTGEESLFRLPATPTRNTVLFGNPEAATKEKVRKASKWSLKELSEFQATAAMDLTKENFLGLETKRQAELLQAIPSEVRKAHGLPMSTGDLRVLEKQQDKNADGIVRMVKSVVHAWTLDAEQWNGWRPDVAIDDDFMETLAEKLHKVKGVPPEFADEVQTFFNTEDDKKAADKVLACSPMLLQHLLPETEAFQLFESAQEFATQYAKEDPGAQAVKDLISMVPEVLRNAFGITAPLKYEKIKSRNWKHDISKVFTTAYFGLSQYDKET